MTNSCRIGSCKETVFRASSLCESHIKTGYAFLLSAFKPEERKAPKVYKKRSPRKPLVARGHGMHIYAIQGDTFVKFGRSKEPRKRLADLQTASPHSLKLLAIIAAPGVVEKQIHRALKGYRAQGEWFHLDDEVQEIIRLMNGGDIIALAQHLHNSRFRGIPFEAARA